VSIKKNILILSRNWILVGFYVFLLFIPPILVEVFMRDIFPITHTLWGDWYFLSINFFLFFYGYLFASIPACTEAVHKYRLGILSVCIILTLGLFFLEKYENIYWITLIFKTLKVVYVYSCIFVIMGYAKEYLSFKHKWLSYLNEAVYPFYILHMPFIVVMGFYIVPLNINLWVKFLILCISITLLFMGVYEGVIKKNDTLRILFGLKNIKVSKSK
jgi:peptidoglycan/LPS O-acetylase OafA/YrhL